MKTKGDLIDFFGPVKRMKVFLAAELRYFWHCVYLEKTKKLSKCGPFFFKNVFDWKSLGELRAPFSAMRLFPIKAFEKKSIFNVILVGESWSSSLSVSVGIFWH